MRQLKKLETDVPGARPISEAEAIALIGAALAQLEAGNAEARPRLLSKADVLKLLGDISYTTLWSWMQEHGFPLALALGPPDGKSTKIMWRADEVFAWIAARPRRKLGRLRRESDASRHTVPARRRITSPVALAREARRP